MEHALIVRARAVRGDPSAATSADQWAAALTLQRSLMPSGVPQRAAVDAAFRHIPAARLAGGSAGVDDHECGVE